MTNLVIPDFIIKIFKKEIKDIHKSLLEKIAEDYNLDKEELLKKYLPEVNIKSKNEENLRIIKSRAYNVNLPIEEQCIAMTRNETQCMRSKLNDSVYCSIHQSKQPYGDILNINKKNKKWEKLY